MAVPSEAHILAFGRLIHNYAMVESGIKIALSDILQVRLADALIVFEPYGAQNLKNVAKSLAKEQMKPALAEEFCCIVGDWAAHNRLRNMIAHYRWTNGARPNSLRARYLSIRDDRAIWYGDGPDEGDFTAEEIEAKALGLHKVNERLKSFLQSSGLQSIIEAKIAETKA